MLERQCHRGPDDSGLRRYEGAVLGARRLAIIDVAHGRQPVTNEDGSICAVQNGEIYNFRELTDELGHRGHSFRSDSDSEVLPHAYEEYGDEFPLRLRGMFAIALWDANRQRLVLARDRMGKKPLVYAHVNGELAFASEIQALLTLPIDRTADNVALSHYLTFGYVAAPRTGFAGIRRLRPGHVITYSNGKLGDERPYWRLAFEPKVRLSEPEALERLRSELDEAVRVRMVSDVPLGAFLSGGLDSSAVVSFMASNSGKPVKTFSIGFPEADFDELRYARLVAQRFGTDHREFVVEPSALDVLPMLVRHLGDPFADSSVVPTYYVAKTARQHVTVALNGDGSDELFGGYDRYRAAQLGLAFDRVPRTARRAAALAAEWLPNSAGTPRFVRRARRFGASLKFQRDDRYLSWVSLFVQPNAVYGPALREAPPDGVFRDILDETGASDELDRLLAVDMRTYLPGDLLVKMDIATMAASLEARSPFLDHKVVEFVTQLPVDLKSRGGQGKFLLRELMRGVLPDEVLTRRKMGFGVPVGKWMRGPLRSLLEDALLAGPERHVVDRREVARLVREHLTGTREHGPQLWALLMLELWFAYVVDDQSSTPSSNRT